jgi:hypothetical protein
MPWVCLQHHVTVVTSNGVTRYSSKFPPTVSKRCQHKHSAIYKTVPKMWNTNNPSCCVTKGSVSSVQHHGSFVHTNSSRLPDVSSCRPTYNKYNITKLNFHSVQPPPAHPLTLPPQTVQLPTHSSTF